MPQMALMWWTTIMLMTLILMLISMTFSYFMLYSKVKIDMKTQNKWFNWKLLQIYFQFLTQLQGHYL